MKSSYSFLDHWRHYTLIQTTLLKLTFALAFKWTWRRRTWALSPQFSQFRYWLKTVFKCAGLDMVLSDKKPHFGTETRNEFPPRIKFQNSFGWWVTAFVILSSCSPVSSMTYKFVRARNWLEIPVRQSHIPLSYGWNCATKAKFCQMTITPLNIIDTHKAFLFRAQIKHYGVRGSRPGYLWNSNCTG